MTLRALRLLTPIAIFTAITVAFFQPTWQQLTSTLPSADYIEGDSILLTWAIGHVSQTIFSDPRHLFDAGIFYPLQGALATTDHMIGQALLGLPIWWLSGNPILEFNLLTLASYVFGACAAYWYAYSRTGLFAAAVAAGVAFVFTPFRFASGLWLQVLVTMFVPIAFAFWLRFARTLAWRDWCLWVAAWTAHSLMGMYLTLYFGILMGALVVFGLAAAPRRHEPRFRMGSLAAPLVVGLLLAPTILPYLSHRSAQHSMRASGSDSSWSLLLPGPGTFTGGLAGIDGGANQFGLGLLPTALALLGMVLWWRAKDDTERFAYRAQLVGCAVTLVLIFTPLRWQQALPGFDMVRCTNRPLHLTFFFGSVFLADAIAWLSTFSARPALRAALIAALAALVVIDTGVDATARQVLPTRDRFPLIYHWLIARRGTEPIYDIVSFGKPAAESMYFAIFHRHPLVGAFSGFRPPGPAYLDDRLIRTFPDAEALRLLDHLGVRIVLVHRENSKAIDAFVKTLPPHGIRVIARFGPDLALQIEPLPATPLPTATAEIAPREWTIHTFDPTVAPASLIDHNPTTVWQSMTLTLTGPPLDPWITIDMGEVHAVTGVRLATPADAPHDASPNQLALGLGGNVVELSVDGEQWAPERALFLPDSIKTLFDRPDDVRYYEARFPSAPARYVRLVNPTVSFLRGPWVIGDLALIGDCDLEPAICAAAGEASPSEPKS